MMWWLLRRGLLIFRLSKFVFDEDVVAALVWFAIVLSVMWWWTAR